MTISEPIGYRIEYRPGRYCFYSLADFQREAQRDGGRIHSLHTQPVLGCPSAPVAYRGNYWCEPEHREGNAGLDPAAVPVYLGPELHDPEVTA